MASICGVIVQANQTCFLAKITLLPFTILLYLTFSKKKTKERAKIKLASTPFPNICRSDNQSILQPQQEASAFMGFAQSDGLTGCIDSRSSLKCQYHSLLGHVREEEEREREREEEIKIIFIDCSGW